MSWLLDTCVLSEVLKPRPEARVLTWLEQQPEEELYISALTIGEFRKGACLLNDAARRRKVERSVQSILTRVGERILPVDEKVAGSWGELQAQAKRSGKVLSAVDALLAATAVAHDLTLVTRNVSDFQPTGVRLFDPWNE